MGAAKHAGILSKGGDGLLKDLVGIVGIGLLVDDVEMIATGEPDPQHDLCHDVQARRVTTHDDRGECLYRRAFVTPSPGSVRASRDAGRTAPCFLHPVRSSPVHGACMSNRYAASFEPAETVSDSRWFTGHLSAAGCAG